MEVIGYAIRYGLTADPEVKTAISVMGTDASNRMTTVTGLTPRTNYTFDVAASHLDFVNSVFLTGPVAARTVVTAMSPGNYLQKCST